MSWTMYLCKVKEILSCYAIITSLVYFLTNYSRKLGDKMGVDLRKIEDCFPSLLSQKNIKDTVCFTGPHRRTK